MFKTTQLILLTSILALLVSCSGKKETSLEPQGISYKASEILVRQCQDISNLELKKLFEKHEVTIKKQISPHLYIVTWKDSDRSADAVVQELKNTTMFCGVERYKEPAQ